MLSCGQQSIKENHSRDGWVRSIDACGTSSVDLPMVGVIQAEVPRLKGFLRGRHVAQKREPPSSAQDRSLQSASVIAPRPRVDQRLLRRGLGTSVNSGAYSEPV